MRTIVLFVDNRRTEEDAPKNRVITRTLRKVGFIDTRYPRTLPYPKAEEHWLVEISRENLSDHGGCFIITPIRKVLAEEREPLVHGMYTIVNRDDSVIIEPNDKDKFWVMSPVAKKSILDATEGARSIVIDHGGGPWPRRSPAEGVISAGARKLAALGQD